MVRIPWGSKRAEQNHPHSHPPDCPVHRPVLPPLRRREVRGGAARSRSAGSGPRESAGGASREGIMAVESCSARLVRLAGETALRMRQPARRAAGSVPAAASICAVLVGVYNIVIGTIYFSERYHFFYGMEGLIATAGSLAFLASFVDVALIFGVLRRKEEYLHSIVCAALAMYMLCGLIPICVLIGLTINMRWTFMLWEVPRLLAYPVHVCVMYCLLAEVRGATQSPPPPPPPPPTGLTPSDGWLQNNLARTGHAPLGADGVLLKLQASGPLGPACVHTGVPPAPASGPISSSEA